jgi:Lon protease-like protein
MAIMPMFPLGSVLMPAMPLNLRIFEERYLKLLGDLLGETRHSSES